MRKLLLLTSLCSKQLLVIAEDFLQELGISGLNVKDITVSGSNAAYSYTPHSDLDLHILVDMSKLPNDDVYQELFTAKKTLYNDSHDISIHGVPVELYVQDINEPHVSSGVYSILHNKWVVKPSKEKVKIDDRKILEKGEEYAKKIDSLIKQGKSKDIISKIDDIRKKLKDFRQSGLESGGEYSYENLTFKLLRRNGYIEKLMKLKTQSQLRLDLPI